MEVTGQRLQKLRRLDLRVFDERHDGGREGGASAETVAREGEPTVYEKTEEKGGKTKGT